MRPATTVEIEAQRARTLNYKPGERGAHRPTSDRVYTFDSKIKPTYVSLDLDKLQDDPVSSQIPQLSGKARAVVLERYDEKSILICLVDSIRRQMVLVPESCLEPDNG